MTQVSTHEAQTRFSELILAASRGQEFLITEADCPMAQIVPVATPGQRPLARAGTARGLVWMAEDFDAPLDDWQNNLHNAQDGHP